MARLMSGHGFWRPRRPRQETNIYLYRYP